MSRADCAEARAIFRAVLANPDDDAPRLVYADWLEECGDADDALRARFVRAQIELASRELRCVQTGDRLFGRGSNGYTAC